MVNYRRSFIPGGTFFFTVTLQNRKLRLLVEKINLLKEAVQRVKVQHPFQIKAYVILPEHLHMIWELPAGDSNYSQRWKKIKTLFSKLVRKSGFELSKTRHNEYLLWQRRFWEHVIRDDGDLSRHIDYIHFNPVKHGIVSRVCDWPYSSFHRYVARGDLSSDWGGNIRDTVGTFGE